MMHEDPPINVDDTMWAVGLFCYKTLIDKIAPITKYTEVHITYYELTPRRRSSAQYLTGFASLRAVEISLGLWPSKRIHK